MTIDREKLLARKSELVKENENAHEHYHSFESIALNLEEIRRIDELLREALDDGFPKGEAL